MLLIIIIFINFISILVFVLIVFLMSSFIFGGLCTIFEGIRSVWLRFRLFFLGFGKAVNFIFIVRVSVIR